VSGGTGRRPAALSNVLRAFAIGGLGLCLGAAHAADSLPSYRTVAVSDAAPEALAYVRTLAQGRVKGCRAANDMNPEAPVPPLPDAQLRKIVFFQTESLYSGPSHAEYFTSRTISADRASNCEPYVAVFREVEVAIDCEHVIIAMDAGKTPAQLEAEIFFYTHPRMKAEPQIHPDGHQHLCVGKVNPALSGAPTVDAGQGTACVWRSQLLWAQMSPQGRQLVPRLAPGPGGGPREKGGDGCLLAERPYYTSEGGPATPIFVKHHSSDRFDELYFGSNEHLTEIQKGASIDPSRFTQAGVERFMNFGVREAMPSE
jgi:hypothetical protein